MHAEIMIRSQSPKTLEYPEDAETKTIESYFLFHVINIIAHFDIGPNRAMPSPM